MLHVIPIVTNGFSHPYHLDESTFIFRDIWSNFSFLFHFSMNFSVSKQNSDRWDAAFCLCPIKRLSYSICLQYPQGERSLSDTL